MLNWWSTNIEQQDILKFEAPSSFSYEQNPTAPTSIGRKSILTLKNHKYEQDDKRAILKIDIIKTTIFNHLTGTNANTFNINIHPMSKNYRYSGCLNPLTSEEYDYNEFVVLKSKTLTNPDLDILDGISDIPFDDKTQMTINDFFEFLPKLADLYKEKLESAYKLINSNTDLANEKETCLEIFSLLKDIEYHPAPSLKDLYKEIYQLKLRAVVPMLKEPENIINLNELDKTQIEFYGTRKVLKAKIRDLSSKNSHHEYQMEKMQIEGENNQPNNPLNQIKANIDEANLSINKINLSINEAKSTILAKCIMSVQYPNAKPNQIRDFLNEVRDSVDEVRDYIDLARDSLNEGRDALNDMRDAVNEVRDSKSFKK